MVGAGTGLAPMMGFLEDRYLAKQAGATLRPTHVFFGCGPNYARSRSYRDWFKVKHNLVFSAREPAQKTGVILMTVPH
jgi:sulfite reductase alpha subunit-like flavoprotein